MKEKGGWRDGPKAAWLLPGESRPVDATREVFINKRSKQTWRFELTRRRSLAELLHGGVGSDLSSWERLGDGAQIARLMDFGDRASNGLMQDCLVRNHDSSQPSKFGQLLIRAMNNSKSSDHSFEHGRRISRTGEAIVFNVGALRHEQSLMNNLEAMQIAYNWHDVDQTVTLQRNLEVKKLGGNLELSSRVGHQLGSAVMLLVLHRRYEEQRKIETKDAWKTCALAAAMCLAHDNQKGFGKLKKATNPGYTVDEDGKLDHYLPDEEIYDLWKNNKLDVLKTTPHIILKLLTMRKSEAGFVTDQSSHGLSPEFEEEYRNDLRLLGNNHRPLIEDLRDSDRETFFLGAEVVDQADVREMIAPAFESLMRTLLEKSRSTKRPFWRSDLSVEKMLDLVKNGSDDLPSKEDCDGRRKLKELLFGVVSHSDVFSESRYIKKVNKENSLMGVLALRLAGERIMKGDLEIVDEVYQYRLDKLKKKALKKAGFSYLHRQRLLFVEKEMEDGNEFIEQELGMKDPKVALNFMGKREQFNKEINLIKKQLFFKPDGAEGVKIYPSEEIGHFLAVTDRVIEIIAKRFNVSKGELGRYKRQAKKFKYQKTLPYGSYDSLYGKPKTFVEPRSLVVQLYESEMHELLQEVFQEE